MKKNIMFFILGLVVASFVYGEYVSSQETENKISKRDKLFVDAKPTDKQTSVLATNNYGPLVDKIVNLEIPTKIYDVSMVAYTREYADRFGYPYSHITDELSKGVDVMQFKLQTEGGMNNCRLDIIIDQSIGVNLPDKDFFNCLSYQFSNLGNTLF